MRFKALLASAVIVAASVGIAEATEIRLGVTGGFGMPFGDFSDFASTGFNLGLIGDRAVNDSWSLGGEIGLHTFGGNDDLEKALSASNGSTTDVSVRLIPMIAHAKYFFPVTGAATPYFKGGMGLYNMNRKYEVGSNSTDGSTTKLGAILGGGVEFKRGAAMTYGVDALYHYIATEGSSSNLISLRGLLSFGFGTR